MTVQAHTPHQQARGEQQRPLRVAQVPLQHQEGEPGPQGAHRARRDGRQPAAEAKCDGVRRSSGLSRGCSGGESSIGGIASALKMVERGEVRVHAVPGSVGQAPIMSRNQVPATAVVRGWETPTGTRSRLKHCIRRPRAHTADSISDIRSAQLAAPKPPVGPAHRHPLEGRSRGHPQVDKSRSVRPTPRGDSFLHARL